MFLRFFSVFLPVFSRSLLDRLTLPLPLFPGWVVTAYAPFRPGTKALLGAADS